MDKQAQLVELISEARTKRKEYEMTLNRIGRIIGTDTNGAELVMGISGVNVNNPSVVKGSTDTIQPIIDYLSSRKGRAVPLKEMFDALHGGCTYRAFSSRVGSAVNKGLVTQLRRGFYSISANAPESSFNSSNPNTETSDLGETATKIYKLVAKYPDINSPRIEKKMKLSGSVIYYHLKNLTDSGLIQRTGRGTYAAL